MQHLEVSGVVRLIYRLLVKGLMICTSHQYYLGDKSRRMRWAGHMACMGERGGSDRVLEGKPNGKRPLGRPRHRWEDNIKMDIQEVGWGVYGLDCSG